MFKRFDTVIKELKAKIDRIDKQMLILTVSMVVYATLSPLLIPLPGIIYNEINFMVQVVLVATILIYAVISIRQTIKSLKHVFPNECFMFWHIANFMLYAVMNIMNRVTNIIAYRIQKKDVEEIKGYKVEHFSLVCSEIELFASFYGILFLLYLIVKFSSTSKRTKFKSGESGRKVPAIAFIKNESVCNKIESELETNELKRREDKLKEEMN